MRVSVCLGAILIPENLDFHSSYSAPRSRIADSWNQFRNIFLFRNIPNERALNALTRDSFGCGYDNVVPLIETIKG